jgi:hypothetical protein
MRNERPVVRGLYGGHSHEPVSVLRCATRLEDGTRAASSSGIRVAGDVQVLSHPVDADAPQAPGVRDSLYSCSCDGR